MLTGLRRLPKAVDGSAVATAAARGARRCRRAVPRALMGAAGTITSPEVTSARRTPGLNVNSYLDRGDRRLRVVRRLRAGRCLTAVGAALGLTILIGAPNALAADWSVENGVGVGTGIVSCPSTKFCAAVGNRRFDSPYVSTFNGSSWSKPTYLDTSDSLAVSLSCASASFCVLADLEGYYSGQHGPPGALTYNGSSWSAPTTIDGQGTSAYVSCPSASFCAAVDYSSLAFTFDGTTWSQPTLIDYVNAPFGTVSFSPTAVSCASASFCVAVDQQGHALTFTGSSWSPPTSVDTTGAEFDSVSCPTASFCMAVDSDGNAFTFNGSSWSGPTSVAPNGYLNSVSCATPTFCAAVGEVAATFDGSTWTLSHNIDLGALTSVSCPSSSFCLAAMDGGIAVYGPGNANPAPPATGGPAGHAAKCVVPALNGVTLARASVLLRQAGCALGRVRHKQAGTKLRGRILAQSVRPNRTLRHGAHVGVTVGR